MSWAPSAQWPRGSGVEFLYIAGVWVGARRSGLPSVSTAWPDPEFHPGDRATDTIYASFAGAAGGNRLLSAQPDDDLDAAIDEDPLDGEDEDGDGHEVRLPLQLGETARAGQALQGVGLRIHRHDASRNAGGDQVREDGVAHLARRGGGADDGDRSGAEQGLEPGTPFRDEEAARGGR